VARLKGGAERGVGVLGRATYCGKGLHELVERGQPLFEGLQQRLGRQGQADLARIGHHQLAHAAAVARLVKVDRVVERYYGKTRVRRQRSQDGNERAEHRLKDTC